MTDDMRRAKWFVSTGGIARMGPFKTQRRAWEAATLTEEARARNHGNPYLPNTRVWPEWPLTRRSSGPPSGR